jgi:hypothetical protein
MHLSNLLDRLVEIGYNGLQRGEGASGSYFNDGEQEE